MNEQDKLFELYKIYISINYDIEKHFNNVYDFTKIRRESLEDAKVALEYFNSQLKEEEQNERTRMVGM